MRQNKQKVGSSCTKKLRISPLWDIQLEFVEDETWNKTDDFKLF